MKPRIVLLGAGNVAASLAPAMRQVGSLVQIYSRTAAHAQQLAAGVGCDATSDLSQLVPDADVYILAVADDAIAPLVEAVDDNGALWIHTSGSTPLSVLARWRKRCGVIYPMQSFSRQLPVDMSAVHLFVEGIDAATAAQVRELARGLSPHVVEADSRQRRALHVAAVFACNYANHMYALAAEVLAEHDLPFEAMMPLIESTVAKLHHLTPAQSQTGPAARGDVGIIAAHEAMLSGDKREIYHALARSIMSRRGLTENET